MRTLLQPGPVHPRRIDWFRDDLHALRFPLRAGATLNEALTAPLAGPASSPARLCSAVWR